MRETSEFARRALVGAETSAMQVTCLPPALPRGMERLGLFWLVRFFSTCQQAVGTGAWYLYLGRQAWQAFRGCRDKHGFDID